MPRTKTTTGPSGPAELARLDSELARVVEQRSAAGAELLQVAGPRNRKGDREGGLIADLQKQIIGARAAAMRTDGESPEVGRLEVALEAATARKHELVAVLWHAFQAEKSIASERRDVLERWHEEFVEIADAERDRGDALLRDAQKAAQAVMAHRTVIGRAARLAIGGVGREEQRSLVERWSPWTGRSSPPVAALQAAVETVAGGSFSAPGSAATVEIGDSSSVVAAAMRSDEHEIEDVSDEELAAMRVEASVNN